MEISTASIKELREKCGAGVMDCRSALVETQGDMEKAAELLKERGCAKAAKKADRVTAHGLAETYVHTGGRVDKHYNLWSRNPRIVTAQQLDENSIPGPRAYAGPSY